MAKLGIDVPQFFENGVPCANYVMYFGIANLDPKTNPKSPYADAALSSALAANLTLDSDGLFEDREIFLSGTYSLLLERPDGTVYWSLTSVEGFQGDAGAVTAAYVDSKVLEEISKNDMFHNDTTLNTGLNFSIGAYRVQRDSGAAYEATTPTSFALSNNNGGKAVVFDLGDGMFYEVDTDSVETNQLYLYTVTTLAGAITTIVDKRTHLSAVEQLPTNYINGLAPSINAADSDHDIDFAAGSCRDSSDSINIIASAMTKQLDAAWSAGNNAGGLFSGSIAASTTYYGFVIADPDGTVDFGFDTDSAAANRPAAYTRFRHLVTFSTNPSSNIDVTTFRLPTDGQFDQRHNAVGHWGSSGASGVVKPKVLIASLTTTAAQTVNFDALMKGFSHYIVDYRRIYSVATTDILELYLGIAGVYTGAFYDQSRCERIIGTSEAWAHSTGGTNFQLGPVSDNTVNEDWADGQVIIYAPNEPSFNRSAYVQWEHRENRLAYAYTGYGTRQSPAAYDSVRLRLPTNTFVAGGQVNLYGILD